MNELLQILNGLSSGDGTANVTDQKRESSKSSDNDNKTTGEDDINGKRKPTDASGKEEAESNKKQKADETE